VNGGEFADFSGWWERREEWGGVEYFVREEILGGKDRVRNADGERVFLYM
jgi:hypothetical protein